MVAEDLKSGCVQGSLLAREHLKVLPQATSQPFTFLNNQGIMQVFWPRPVRVRTCLPARRARHGRGDAAGHVGWRHFLETRAGSTLPELSCKQRADRRHPRWVDPALLAQVALLAFN